MFGLPSQSPKPLLHDGTHTPAVQLVVPFVAAHCVPQAPQLLTVPRLASQPLPALPSQFPNPALHVMLHAPAEQVGVPPAVLHAVVQVPQCVVSVAMLASQPSPTEPLQSPKPVLQPVTTHVPVAQVPVPFGGLQIALHAPQLFAELSAVSHPLAVLPSQSP